MLNSNIQACDGRCVDITGRKNLFEVLDSQHPARPADDAWMGNMLVDPAKGKAHAAGPEERMGRKDLFALMQQRILTQPSTNAPPARRVSMPTHRLSHDFTVPALVRILCMHGVVISLHSCAYDTMHELLAPYIQRDTLHLVGSHGMIRELA